MQRVPLRAFPSISRTYRASLYTFQGTRSLSLRDPSRLSVLSAADQRGQRNPFQVQSRTVFKDFYESFRKNWKKNIEQEAEFGGDLKRLQQTSDSVKEVAKTTKESGSMLRSKVAQAVKDRINQSVESTAQRVKESSDRLKQATAPYYEEALSETKKHIDMEKLRETQESVSKAFEETRRRAADAAQHTSEAARKTGEAAGKYIDPMAKTVTDSKIVKDYKVVSQALNTKKSFNPTPEKKTMGPKSYTTEIATSRQSRWKGFKEKMETQWNELGDSNSRLSYLVDVVDSLSERWKKISSSPMGIMIGNLKREYPDFELDAFQEWATKELMPRVLTSPSYDEYVQTHSGDLIKQLYKTKQLPLPWTLVNISTSDVFPAQNSGASSTDYRFFFSVRGQVKEIEKETDKEILYNIVLMMAVRLNEEKVWVLSEFTEVEKTTAFF